MTVPLGRLVTTPGALNALEQNNMEPIQLIRRHEAEDWGDLSPEDKHANVVALMHGCRVFSAYKIGEDKFYVITESDRSATTVLLADEY